MRAPPRDVLGQIGIADTALARVPWEDPIWLFDADGRQVVLSHKTGRTDADLAWEGVLLDALEDAGFPSVRSVKLFGGRDFVSSDGGHFVLRTWIGGQTLVELGGADLFALGRFIAELHGVTCDLRLDQRPGFGELTGALRAPTDDQLRSVLPDERAVERFRAIVEDVAPNVEDAGGGHPIHGDFTTRNVVGDGAPPRIVGLIDFGMAMVASPVVEIAFALGSARPNYGSVEHMPERVTEIVAGYESIRSLPPDAAPRIVDFARARPLLAIAVRVRSDRPPLSTKAFERSVWLSDNRDAMIAAIRDGLAS